MKEQDYEQELMEAMRDEQADDSAESEQSRLMDQYQFNEAYGAPEPEEKVNQHAFINKTVFDNKTTLRASYLKQEELGRADFAVRFLMNLHLIAKQMIDPVCEEFGLKKDENMVANYFKDKVEIITSSGLSNEGFIQNLNATKKIEATRKRVRDISGLKQGDK